MERNGSTPELFKRNPKEGQRDTDEETKPRGEAAPGAATIEPRVSFLCPSAELEPLQQNNRSLDCARKG